MKKIKCTLGTLHKAIAEIESYQKELDEKVHNLYAIKQLLDSMVDGFQKSGMFKSGAMRMLPIRR